MTDTARSWIEERRGIHATAVEGQWLDAYMSLPRALSALEQVLEQVEFMESDAEACFNAGHNRASEALLDYAEALRQAIEGAINHE